MIELKEQTKLKKTGPNQIGVIVFKYDNNNDFLGLTCNEWLNVATMDFNRTFIDASKSKNLEDQILLNLPNEPVTVVLHAFNPLITKQDILFYVDYLTYKNLELIKLPFGYVFKTDYIKQTKSFREPIMFGGIANEFLKVDTKQGWDLAYAIKKQEIINKHIKNGVNFVDVNSTIIHYFVEIEPDVTIYPFNMLYGKTKIERGAVIKEGNTIDNSWLQAECVVAKSVVNNSKIGAGTIVLPFNTINNSQIDKNCLIKSYNQIEKAVIAENTTVDSFNNLGN